MSAPKPALTPKLTPKSSWAIPPDLAKAGFEIPSSETIYRLVVASASHEKSGKSHFALSAPGPIGYIDTDAGSEGVVNKFLKRGKKVVRLDCKPPSDIVRMFKKGSDIDTLKKVYEPSWLKIANAYEALLESKTIRTIVFDTATEIYETLKLVRFGKLTQVKPHHYGPVNDEYRTFVRQIYDTDKNLILLHKVKKQYESSGKKDKDGEMKDAWNGKWELAGYGDTKFLAQVNIQNYRQDNEGDSDGDFALRVLDCRQNPDCANMEFIAGECDFPNLAAAVHENDPEEWKD